MTERMTPFALMEKLISFPTVSRESNIPLVDWVADYLASPGTATRSAWLSAMAAITAAAHAT